MLETNAEIQGEVRFDAIVVLEEEGIVAALVGPGGVDIVSAVCRKSQKERSEVLSQRSGGSIVQRTLRPVRSKEEVAVGETKTGLTFPKLAEIRSKLQAVFAEDPGETLKNLKRVDLLFSSFMMLFIVILTSN